LAAFRTALATAPERESTSARESALAARAGRREEAIASWQLTIAINPWLSYDHAELALPYAQGRDWRLAAQACREALRLNPANTVVRELLIQCHCRLGDLAAARAEFETLLGFDPPGREPGCAGSPSRRGPRAAPADLHAPR
jgi:tetratricopeptide (TPR) repeat protein